MRAKLVKKEINKNGPKHGTQNQKAQKKGPTTEKKRKDEAQGTKGRFEQQAARNTKKGRKYIYIFKIYMKRRIYVYIYIYISRGYI